MKKVLFYFLFFLFLVCLFSPTLVHFFCGFSFLLWCFLADLEVPQQLKLSKETTLTFSDVPFIFDWELIFLPNFQITQNLSGSNYPLFLTAWLIKNKYVFFNSKTVISYSLIEQQLLEVGLEIYRLSLGPFAFAVGKTKFVLYEFSLTTFRFTFFSLGFANISYYLTPFFKTLLLNFSFETQQYLFVCLNLYLTSLLSQFLYEFILPIFVGLLRKWIFPPNLAFLLEQKAEQLILPTKN